MFSNLLNSDEQKQLRTRFTDLVIDLVFLLKSQNIGMEVNCSYLEILRIYGFKHKFPEVCPEEGFKLMSSSNNLFQIPDKS